jgi:hypothetical protein
MARSERSKKDTICHIVKALLSLMPQVQDPGLCKVRIVIKYEMNDHTPLISSRRISQRPPGQVTWGSKFGSDTISGIRESEGKEAPTDHIPWAGNITGAM